MSKVLMEESSDDTHKSKPEPPK
ncbi:hypothetical protein RRG08_057499 [Elysia crispata]|uniref:Uncharacterized protein n=1 Tax=Elysia crispata TaxID=231223 RepID=A0AAE1DL91_9GAST|nr:hypothetical protein RRG08_057499 [Elysia crispata]